MHTTSTGTKVSKPTVTWRGGQEAIATRSAWMARLSLATDCPTPATAAR